MQIQILWKAQIEPGIKQSSLKQVLLKFLSYVKDLILSFAAAVLCVCIFLFAWAVSICNSGEFYFYVSRFDDVAVLYAGASTVRNLYKGFSKQELPVHDKPNLEWTFIISQKRKPFFPLLISQPASY